MKGPNGRNICRCGCKREVSPPRRNWFSQECVDAWRLLHDWAFIRDRVLERDKGRCSKCGRECLTIQARGWEIYRLKITKQSHSESAEARDWCDFMLANPGFDLSTDYWQADHIVPRVRGGTHELANLRTLCVPCHKEETKKLAHDRARERKREKLETLQREIQQLL